MNDLEKMIMDEITTLNEMRLIDVLGFIRYLKAEKPVKQKWMEEWFDHALRTIHERADEFQVAPEQIRVHAANMHKKRSSNG